MIGAWDRPTARAAACWVFWPAPCSARRCRAARRQGIGVGCTPAFVHDQHALPEDWRRHMQSKLTMRVDIEQCDSYRETMDLLRLKQLDFAWVCDYPFLMLKDLVRLLAVPL